MKTNLPSKLPNETQILIVDDETDFRNALAFSFKRKGYQILSASNGKEAFDLIQLNQVDVVISDIQMAGGSGIELLERIRNSDRGIPVILLVTGYAELSTQEACSRGAEALFSKPFDRKQLEETVLRLLIPCEERWSHPPGHSEIDLNIKLKFQDLARPVNAKVIDLGNGGMFVTLPQCECPNVNDLTEFKMSLEDKGPLLDGSGVVRWVRISPKESRFPAGFGIEFTYLGNFEREQVVAYLNAKKI